MRSTGDEMMKGGGCRHDEGMDGGCPKEGAAVFVGAIQAMVEPLFCVNTCRAM